MIVVWLQSATQQITQKYISPWEGEVLNRMAELIWCICVCVYYMNARPPSPGARTSMHESVGAPLIRLGVYSY